MTPVVVVRKMMICFVVMVLDEQFPRRHRSIQRRIVPRQLRSRHVRSMMYSLGVAGAVVVVTNDSIWLLNVPLWNLDDDERPRSKSQNWNLCGCWW